MRTRERRAAGLVQYSHEIDDGIRAGQQARSLFPFDPFLFSAQATELPKPYVKWSCEPARAEDVPQAIAHGYYLAMQPPRGPVLVSIPSDDWARACGTIHYEIVTRIGGRLHRRYVGTASGVTS